MHYLIVDDNRALADNLAEILRDGGAEVSVAADGSAALSLARGTRFDALVTDMRMPVMGGAALVHQIRQIDPCLPAIVVTAYTGESDLADARREGVLAVLPKPIPIEQLEQLLQVARRDALVAIVEDDAHLADNLSEALRARGFTAVTACSALDAERLGPIAPMAALVDLRLGDGVPGSVLARLAERFPQLPLIVITGFPDALPSGVRPHAVFTKPFDTHALLASLEQLHLRREAAR
ncbi:MAG: response regulator [Archangiaceae bacterium]|nr:response regulator [Archangiaceae bacterium]